MVFSIPFRLRAALLAALCVSTAVTSRAQLASLTADLTPFTGSNDNSSNPYRYSVVRGRATFLARESDHSASVWSTDGTAAGTELLIPGPGGLGNPDPLLLGSDGRVQFWWVTDRNFENEVASLWVTDGTEAGSKALASFDGSALGHVPDTGFPVTNGKLFFTRVEASGTLGLWTSDGTAAGTRLVLDSESGPRLRLPVGLTMLQGQVLFGSTFGPDEDIRAGLFRTDGTAAGTALVREIPDLPLDGVLRIAGNRVFFFTPRQVGFESHPDLWTSDGSTAGTVKLRELRWDHLRPDDTWLAAIDGQVYFPGEDGNDIELWTSNGTAGGTRRITDLGNPSPLRSPFRDSSPRQITRLGGKVLFLATDEAGRAFLGATDGPPASTIRLANLILGGDLFHPLAFPVRHGNRVYFARSLDDTDQLWRSDGTVAGTIATGLPNCSGELTIRGDLPGDPGALYATGCPSPAIGTEIYRLRDDGSAFERLTNVPLLESLAFDAPPIEGARVGGKLVFTAIGDGIVGSELWATDGAPGSTALVRDLLREQASSSVHDLAPLGLEAVFLAGGTFPNPIWRTGGSESTTRNLADLPALGCTADSDGDLRVVGGKAFFVCATGGGKALWRSDGSAGGTLELAGESSLGNGPRPERLFATGSLLLMTDSNSSSPYSLWRSDGTPGGTFGLITRDSGTPVPELETTTHDGLLFYTVFGQGGRQLWRTDGTLAGTFAVTAADEPFFLPFPPFSELRLADVAGTRYFLAERFLDDGLHSLLYRSFDAPEDAEVALDLSELGLESPRGLSALGNHLFVFADHLETPSTARPGLWRTDGTPAGTAAVREDLVLTNGDVLAARRYTTTTHGGKLYFTADDGEHGAELWQSDGTSDGTRMLRDVAPGPHSARIAELLGAGNRVFFSAYTPNLGRELWVTDGIAEGTRLVHDIAPGPFSSSPEQLAVAGNRLYFTADDGIHGRELWSLSLDETGCVPSERALCLQDGRFRVETDWKDFQGNEGRGTAVALTPDTGYFWFFQPTNVEAVLKVLDGRGLNDHFWTFYGALSTVEYSLTVNDAETGVSRRYYNPPGNLASRADTASFGPNGASLERYTPPAEEEGALAEIFGTDSLDVLSPRGSCVPASNRLCLRNGRFAVEANWRDFQGNSGTGTAVEITGDTGTFWFFRPENLEVILKVLDGTGLNGKHWVFYGALSSVEYTLTVTDTSTGAVRTYFNPLGRLASVADTGAF